MMKRISIFLGISALVLSSCQDKRVRHSRQTFNVPVYAPYSEFRSTISSEDPRGMVDAGKIYYYNDYLLVNERRTGIHVYDLRVPSNPVSVAFIPIPGNTDMSIRNNKLYANSYMDLVVFDVQDMQEIASVGRVENAFDEYGSIPVADPRYPIHEMDFDKGAIVGWELRELIEETDVDSYPYYGGHFGLAKHDNLVMESVDVNVTDAGQGGGGVGVGGSMARFTVAHNTLYTLESFRLTAYDLADPVSPVMSSEQWVSGNAETVFPYGDQLFLGTDRGMLIYDLYDPQEPVYRSMFSHILSCDPVVVSEDMAYVTLRDGMTCRNGVNELQLVDISNLDNPTLVADYVMTNPHGLGIQDNTLYVCDGEDGLKVYDVEDPHNVLDNQIAHFSGIQTYDVIPLSKCILMTSEEGIFIYQHSNNEMTQVAAILSSNED